MEDLRSYLDKEKMYPTKQEKEERLKAYYNLNKTVQEWGKQIYKETAGAGDDTDVCAARLLTYGSFRLDVYGRGSDIDACIIANRDIDRYMFETRLQPYLLSDKNVQDVHFIPSKRMPHFTLTYSGIEVDLNFSKTILPSLPKNEKEMKEALLDEKLSNIVEENDGYSVRAINGTRNADMILQYIPQDCNELFTMIVRTIKLWSKKRGIYGFVYCFLNGISIEIMVARVIKENYSLSAVRLLEQFFKMYAEWDWERDSIVLGQQDDCPERKKEEMVHVITPASPRANTLDNITRSSLNLFKKELRRGYDIVHTFNDEKPNDWDILFRRRHALCAYPVFIQLRVKAETPEKLASNVKGVEAPLGKLLRNLEELTEIEDVNVIPEQFPDKDDPATCYLYVGMRTKRDVKVDVSQPLNTYLSTVTSNKELLVDAQIKKRSEIPPYHAHKPVPTTHPVPTAAVSLKERMIKQEIKEEIDEEIKEEVIEELKGEKRSLY